MDMRTATVKILTFDELSDAAKEKAREWWRRCEEGDSSYKEPVYEDAQQCGAVLGIEIDTRPFKTVGGGTLQEACIFWSGFSSQGDGACFEGTYRYAKGAAKAIRKHAPQDTRLHDIADRLQALQRPASYKLEARVKHRGHYYHEFCTDIDVSRSDDRDVTEATEKAVTEAMRDFMRWIYRQLESAYEWTMADEQVDASIRSNEYEFEADGALYQG